MAPSPFTDDYYAILDVEQTADDAEIKSSYKRLARIRHPDKNQNSPKATSEFQLLQAAFSTLIDPAQRRTYDNQYHSIRCRAQATTQAKKDASASRAAKSEDTPPRRDPSHKTSPQTDEAQQYKQRLGELGKTLGGMRMKKTRLGDTIFEARRKVIQSRSTLSKLQAEIDREKEEDRNKNKDWLTYLFGERIPPEITEAKERRATERRMGQMVREAELERNIDSLRKAEAQLDSLDAAMAKVQEETTHIMQQAKRHQKAARMAEEARQREQEKERARKEEERVKKEEEKRLKELREYVERRRKEEEERRAREEKLRRAEAEKQLAAQLAELLRREKERKAQEERLRNLYSERAKTGGGRAQSGHEGRGQDNRPSGPGAAADATSCRHKRWWTYETGSHICGRCQYETSHFAFRCPKCRMLSCADCLDILKRGT